MSVYKLGNSWWVDIGFQYQRIRKRSPENSRSGARAYETVLRSKLARGEPVEAVAPAQQLTFAEFSTEKWLPTYVFPNNKPSEQRRKKSTLRYHLVPAFGSLNLSAITVEKIEAFKARKCRDGLSPKTINNTLTVLNSCLKTAVEWGYLPHPPRIKFLAALQPDIDFLTEQEYQQLLASISDPMWYTMVLIAIKTGLRFGELLALQWDAIDFDQRLITVKRSIVQKSLNTPKSNRIRYVPLTSDVIQHLQALRNSPGGQFLWVFTRWGDRPLNEKSLHRALQRFLKAAGLRHIRWHELRHTFATLLICKGVPLRVLQGLMGHSDIHTTLRYAHLYPNTMRHAIGVLEPEAMLNTDYPMPEFTTTWRQWVNQMA